MIQNLRTNCLNFYIELFKQTYKRFPFHKPEIQLLEEMAFVDLVYISVVTDIYLIAQEFNFDIADVYIECRMLKTKFRGNTERDFDKFWNTVRECKDANDEPLFLNLLKIVDIIRILPQTSVSCERIFSCVNHNKTKSRSCLQNESLTGILYDKNLLKHEKCLKYKVDKKMYRTFNGHMYYKKN